MPKLRVLLIDDESVVLQSLEFLLQLLGFAIAGTAADFDAAMLLASAAEADVAVLDINLNGQLVYPAADALIARDIPIIFTSGRLTNLPDRYLSTTFIGKPYLPELLIDHIERLTSQAQEMKHNGCRTLEDAAARANDARASAETARLRSS